jgi:inner membrane protein involved in colicin E2 resistance
MRPPRARTLAPIVRWDWTRIPPVMERSLRDDVKVAFCILLGATLGYLLLGADDPGLLVGALVGNVVLIVVLNVVRRMSPRR